jgi:hypothetical protein
MFGVMRRATAIALTICCGVLFGCWLLPVSFLIAGRTSFGRVVSPIEYICFAFIGLMSGFGLKAGLRALFSRSDNSRAANGPGRLARTAGWMLTVFGALAVNALAQVRGQTASFSGLGFIAYPAVVCLALGGACLFAFRKRPE